MSRKKGVANTLRVQLYALFLITLIVFFSVVISMQFGGYMELAKKEQVIKQKIEDEIKLGEQLDTELSQRGSLEYIEKVAREQLGLVMPDDILFYRDNTATP